MPTRRTVTPSEAAPESPPAAKGVCGHINRHSLGTDNKHDNLACAKDSGHDGLHGAIHKEYVPTTDTTKKLIGKRYFEIKPLWREWSNAAGVPVSQITPQPIPRTPEEEARLRMAKEAVGGDIPGEVNLG